MTPKTKELSKARIVSACADVQSAKLMYQMAGILNSKVDMQIRYISTLQWIACDSGEKILIIPLSSE